MRTVLRHLIAARVLLSLACATRFRMRGSYWQWRYETAFGTDPARMPGPKARRHAIVDYANWVASMRRLSRR